jgi:hypothetical protein
MKIRIRINKIKKNRDLNIDPRGSYVGIKNPFACQILFSRINSGYPDIYSADTFYAKQLFEQVTP